MTGSVVLLLLLSLLALLATGSGTRRIRKRGLNHKVGMLTLVFSLFYGRVCMRASCVVSFCLTCCFLEYPPKWKEVKAQCVTAQYQLCCRELPPWEQLCGWGERWSSWPCLRKSSVLWIKYNQVLHFKRIFFFNVVVARVRRKDQYHQAPADRLKEAKQHL